MPRTTVGEETSQPNIRKLAMEAGRYKQDFREKQYPQEESNQMSKDNDVSTVDLVQQNVELNIENQKLKEEGEQIRSKMNDMNMEIKYLTDKLISVNGDEDKNIVEYNPHLEYENKKLQEANDILKQDNQRLVLENTQLSSRITELESKPAEYVNVAGMHEIIEGFLWLGDRFAAADSKSLKKLGITHLLTLYGTHQYEDNTPIITFCVPLADDGSSDLASVFPKCFAFINGVKERKEKVLVHCAAGVNRSPSIVIAYLMFINHWTLKEAFQYVQDIRGCIQPSLPYIEQLEMYEDVLFGRTKPSETSQDDFSFANIIKFWFGSNSRPIIF